MIAPQTFIDKLARYDPDLTVRWGVRTHLWFIERPMPERHKQLLSERPCPWKSLRGLDLYDGWKLGRVYVLAVHPTLLDNWPLIEETLRSHDAWKAGGFQKIDRMLDDIEEEWERKTDKLRDDFCQDAAKEAHDRLQWLLGNRLAMPFAEEPERRREPETRDGYLVIDRRGAR